MQYKILFVDDETANLRLLERLFRNSYDIYTASTGDEALDLLSVHDIALIVSDQRMPGMTGLEFLKLAAERRPQTVRIILTGYTDANDLVDAINSGVVYKYVTKPWVNEELKQTVKRSLQHYESTRAQRRLQTENERLKSRLKSATDGCVDMVLTMLETQFPKLREHAERTAAVAALVGERFVEMDRESRETLRLGAMLHEAVLFTAPREIREKGQQIDEHRTALGKALDAGAAAIDSVPELAEASGVLRFLFESYDGRGFPFGFAGAQIPMSARILAAASTYDQLRQPGPGTDPLTHRDAIDSLRRNSGTRFDPEVIDALADVCAYADLYQSEELLTLA
ncbi:MAG: response regulator [Acidobacteria bacterium]|nr:response regulator [Acidobacteriota bacterium]